ncbi:hypothetical protein NGH15_25925 [Escherichia coli]|nr:hypothetical protein [Escherichia coli]
MHFIITYPQAIQQLWWVYAGTAEKSVIPVGGMGWISKIIGVRLENGIYGHSRFCNTDFDDKLACLNLSGV